MALGAEIFKSAAGAVSVWAAGDRGDGYIRNETGRCRKYRALHKEIETEQNGNHEFQEYASVGFCYNLF